MYQFGQAIGVISIVGAISVLAGCGGGGGGGATAVAQGGSSATMHLLRTGDQWDYNLSGELDATSGQKYPITGSAHFEVGSATLNTLTFNTMVETITVTANNQTATTTETVYFTQDPTNHSITEIADKASDTAALKIVSTPQVIYPGTWTSPLSQRSQITFNDGTFENTLLSVNNIETVNTSGGNYNAYKAVLAETASSGSTTHTEWWAPEIGNFVKTTESAPISLGQLTVTLQLVSTNVSAS
ncbi:hypothetical protein CCAX7_23820 [Capsulimonas corticalis]|uniref:Uncharacterized protein n=1 Tax=Capsulimonas corticalis TaxID=2219043 RepID=A0A402CV72_9BACT|nr:hypothetical protein [Capsulimonas corticalis]BDI30331.1 hypothetical protein CCAX7_23820 [Capsulimonas corticalis]